MVVYSFHSQILVSFIGVLASPYRALVSVFALHNSMYDYHTAAYGRAQKYYSKPGALCEAL